MLVGTGEWQTVPKHGGGRGKVGVLHPASAPSPPLSCPCLCPLLSPGAASGMAWAGWGQPLAPLVTSCGFNGDWDGGPWRGTREPWVSLSPHTVTLQECWCHPSRAVTPVAWQDGDVPPQSPAGPPCWAAPQPWHRDGQLVAGGQQGSDPVLHKEGRYTPACRHPDPSCQHPCPLLPAPPSRLP